MSVAVVRAASVVTGWGAGVAAVPVDAHAAAAGRRVIVATPKPRAGDRLRRATRECLLGVDAVEGLLEGVGLTRADLAGDRTALIYVTAAAYGASNRAFVEGGGGALHFPYTAPSAVPAEVAIEFGLHGAYTVLIGGATTTLAALDHASTLLARGACDRAVVLAVETFADCEDLYARARWLVDWPLVEAAAAVLLELNDDQPVSAEGEPVTAEGGLGGAPRVPPTSNKDGLGGASRVPPIPNSVAPGNTFACAPLIDLAQAHAKAASKVALKAQWRGRDAAMSLAVAGRGAGARS